MFGTQRLSTVAFAALSAVVSIVVVLGLGSPSPAAATSATAIANSIEPSAANTMESDILRLTNEARAIGRNCGDTWFAAVPALTWDDRLGNAARAHSLDMGTRNYFDHITPDGVTPWTRISNAGYSYLTAAENIAAGYAGAPEVVTGWLNSVGHCRNIMSPNVTQLGVGFAEVAGSTFGKYYTQNFATPTAVSTPTPPTLTEATPGNTSVTLSYTPSANNGGAPVLRYEYSLDNGATWRSFDVAIPTSPTTISGLTNGTTYVVRMRAVNSQGNSAPSASREVTPQAPAPPPPPPPPGQVPAAPSGVTVIPGYRELAVAFTPGSPGSSSLTGYEYSLDGGTTWQPAAAGATTSPLVITGVINGVTHNVAIRAVSAAGKGAPSTAVPATAKGAVFTPISPVRLYDSRLPGAGGALPSGLGRELDTASAGVPPGTVAVAYNLTITDTQGSGYLEVAPGGSGAASGTSTINWSAPGQTLANGFNVGINAAQRFAVVAGGGGSTHFIIDIVGVYAPETAAPAGSVFVPIDPARAYDSRAAGAGGPLGNGSMRTVSVAASGQVPTNATAIAFNLTETDTFGAGFLAVAPAGTPKPAVSSINWTGNQTMANGSIVGVNNREVDVWTGGGGSAQFVIDVVGYFVPATSAPDGARFTATTPARAYDSRNFGASGRLAGGPTARVVSAALGGAIPANAIAVAYNFTETDTTDSGYFATAPGRPVAAPSTSVINWTGPQTLANGTVSKISSQREMSVFAGPTSPTVGGHFIIDIAGYFN